MPRQQLVGLLEQWKKRLEMTDWEIDLYIVDFKRDNNYRQSGDFEAVPERKTASILMTWDPWRGDEEYTLVHELLHVLAFDYDSHCEALLLQTHASDSDEYGMYMENLESLLHHLTRVLVGRTDR